MQSDRWKLVYSDLSDQILSLHDMRGDGEESNLAASRPEVVADLKGRFRQMLHDHADLAAHIVQIHAAVPYQEYVQRLSDAWALLLLASPSDNLLVPSKMLDYFGAQRPVLAFVPSESETYDILQQTGMQEFVSTENDVAGGCNSITRLWQAWKDGTLPVDSAKTYQWSASHQVQRVIELLSD